MNSQIGYFSQNIESHLSDIFPKNNKIKPYVYDCILSLLQGRFYLDTLTNTRNRCSGNYNITDRFKFITRPVSDENIVTIEQRARDIIERIFVKRKGNIGSENLDKCADIVAQIGVHR